LDLFNKEENTLECPVCYTVHTFKSKNIFKKTLQQVAHSNFGKKTTIREVSFASTMVRQKKRKKIIYDFHLYIAG
jgi:hypothetical protein